MPLLTRVQKFLRGPPRVGLAISGGGCKAFFGLGVGQVLLEAGIPITAISGTSAGSAMAFTLISDCTEDVVDFYQPVLDWLGEYRNNPNPRTEFSIKLIYFNTASSKLILDILMILEEMVEEGHDVLIRWLSLASDEDMQEAGREYEEMIEVPFEHVTYEL